MYIGGWRQATGAVMALFMLDLVIFCIFQSSITTTVTLWPSVLGREEEGRAVVIAVRRYE